MSTIKIGLSMLFCLSEPFTSLLSRLENVNVHYVELLDEGLHTLNGKRVKKLRKIAEAHNIEFMVHSPFADINIATPSPSFAKNNSKTTGKVHVTCQPASKPTLDISPWAKNCRDFFLSRFRLAAKHGFHKATAKNC